MLESNATNVRIKSMFKYKIIAYKFYTFQNDERNKILFLSEIRKLSKIILNLNHLNV